MRIIALSDTHGRHRQVQVPPGDILIHSGDFTNIGEIELVEDFNRWLGEQPHRHKIVTPGNHDRSMETGLEVRKMITNAHLLVDEGIEIEGVKFWASPWTPNFFEHYWKFNKSRTALYDHWEQIPEDIQVLITHGPPASIRDFTGSENVGDRALMARVGQLKHLKLHLFGHIHEDYGHDWWEGIDFYNCSVLDAAYKLARQPHIIDFAAPETVFGSSPAHVSSKLEGE